MSISKNIINSIFVIISVSLANISSASIDETKGTVSAEIITTFSDSTIYTNGHILTIDDANPSVEAVAVKEGKVFTLGTLKEVKQRTGGKATIVDLDGKTMMPGFIDAHGHIADYLMFWGLPNLASPPVSDVQSINDLVVKMQRYIEVEQVTAGNAAIGFGYDDSMLEERRHPTRQELDRVSSEHPVCVIHISGHLASCNTLALNTIGFVAGVANPKGGVIVRNHLGVPTGVLEEQAVYGILPLLEPKGLDKIREEFTEIQRYFASKGITTAQDGATLPNSLAMLQQAAKRDELLIDVVSYPKWSFYENIFTDTLKPGSYKGHLKVAGVKVVLDGSPQGKTAYLREPYKLAPAGQTEDYRGYPIMPQAEINDWVERMFVDKVQIQTHCNGDACADMLLDAISRAQKIHGKSDRRPVMVHAQTVRQEQIERMAELGVIPSFFSSHTFFWGDWHRDSVLGQERANNISPLGWAHQAGIKYTIHNDTPVVPPDILPLVWSSVNRLTRSGAVLGQEQRVTVMDALKAVTIHAAYQYFEEDTKGSIEPGKLADLVILSNNPLLVDPLAIRDIEVLETIKEGITVYRK